MVKESITDTTRDSIESEDESLDSNSRPKPYEVAGETSNLKILNSQVLDNNMPYTILTTAEIRWFSALLALIGLCSSISMPIYWAALTDIQNYFRITSEQANLTVTAYLVFQAVAPVFVSSSADYFGRRPVVLCCLIGGVCANIGLAVSNKYWLIMFLRCLLASCVAPLVSIDFAIVGDITTRRNRGGISGYVSGFTLIGQGIAPFLGAVFDSAWNWRAIFWFSAAFDGLVLITVLLFLPETRRTIVGNLSVPPKSIIYQSPIVKYHSKRLVDAEGESLEKKTEDRFNPFKPFILLKEPEVICILLPCSIFFATWTVSQVTLTTSLSKDYHYKPLKVGLCFFSPGISTIIGTLCSGRSLDYIYRRRRSKYMNGVANKPKDAPLEPFNIIAVRLCLCPIFTGLLFGATMAYGWCVEYKETIAAILVLSFFITFGTMYPLNVASTLLVDLHPDESGGSSSLNNLFRCGMSAIFVSCVDMMNTSLTIGGTYTLMGCLCLLGTIVLEIIVLLSRRLLERKRKRDGGVARY